MKTLLPTFTQSGYLEDIQPNLKMFKHYQYWLTSKRNQCRIIDDIPNFESILMDNQGKQSKLIEELQRGLTTYFLEIADSVDVVITISDDSPSEHFYILNISLTWVNEGVKGNLANNIEVTGDTFKIVEE